MKYVIKIVEAGEVLFGGSTLDRQELYEVATEARRLRPTARILLRSPWGEIVEYDPVTEP